MRQRDITLIEKVGMFSHGKHEQMDSTVRIAQMFGIEYGPLRTALWREPDAPKPTHVSIGINGNSRMLWNESDRNKLALWWVQRQERIAARKKG